MSLGFLKIYPNHKSSLLTSSGFCGIFSFHGFLAEDKTRIEDKYKKVLKCAQCGLSQLKQKCCTSIYAKAIFKTNKESISLVRFDDKLKALDQLNSKEIPKIFEQLFSASLTNFSLLTPFL